MQTRNDSKGYSRAGILWTLAFCWLVASGGIEPIAMAAHGESRMRSVQAQSGNRPLNEPPKTLGRSESASRRNGGAAAPRQDSSTSAAPAASTPPADMSDTSSSSIPTASAVGTREFETVDSAPRQNEDAGGAREERRGEGVTVAAAAVPWLQAVSVLLLISAVGVSIAGLVLMRQFRAELLVRLRANDVSLQALSSEFRKLTDTVTSATSVKSLERRLDHIRTLVERLDNRVGRDQYSDTPELTTRPWLPPMSSSTTWVRSADVGKIDIQDAVSRFSRGELTREALLKCAEDRHLRWGSGAISEAEPGLVTFVEKDGSNRLLFIQHAPKAATYLVVLNRNEWVLGLRDWFDVPERSSARPSDAVSMCDSGLATQEPDGKVKVKSKGTLKVA